MYIRVLTASHTVINSSSLQRCDLSILAHSETFHAANITSFERQQKVRILQSLKLFKMFTLSFKTSLRSFCKLL